MFYPLAWALVAVLAVAHEWWLLAGLVLALTVDEWPPLWYYGAGILALLALGRLLGGDSVAGVLVAAGWVAIGRAEVPKWRAYHRGYYRGDTFAAAAGRVRARLFGRRAYVAVDRYGTYLCNLTTKRSGPPLPEFDTMTAIEERAWRRYALTSEETPV